MLWFEGAIHPDTTRPFDLADRGLTLGDGLFDTALCLNGRVAFAGDHVERLAASAGTLGFALPARRVREAMDHMALRIGDGSLRTTVTRGSGPRGLAPPASPAPVWWITAAPRIAGSAFAPVTLLPTDIRRNETSPASRLKTLGYLDAVLAGGEARAQGFDEALFLNLAGMVACAGTGNLLAVIDGRLVTPPLSDGVLPGIVRGRLLALARSLGIGTEERSLDQEACCTAQAVVMTNSLRCLSPVTAIGPVKLPADNAVAAMLGDGLRHLVAGECGVAPEVL